jgi:hypothetical protein
MRLRGPAAAARAPRAGAPGRGCAHAAARRDEARLACRAGAGQRRKGPCHSGEGGTHAKPNSGSRDARARAQRANRVGRAHTQPQPGGGGGGGGVRGRSRAQRAGVAAAPPAAPNGTAAATALSLAAAPAAPRHVVRGGCASLLL